MDCTTVVELVGTCGATQMKQRTKLRSDLSSELSRKSVLLNEVLLLLLVGLEMLRRGPEVLYCFGRPEEPVCEALQRSEHIPQTLQGSAGRKGLADAIGCNAIQTSANSKQRRVDQKEQRRGDAQERGAKDRGAKERGLNIKKGRRQLDHIQGI